MTGFLHGITHRHVFASKEGIGEFCICAWRLPRSGCHVLFRPDLSGAGWHPLPEDRDEDGLRVVVRMLSAGSAEEAMAMLRGATAA